VPGLYEGPFHSLPPKMPGQARSGENDTGISAFSRVVTGVSYTRAGLFERPPLFDQAYALNRLFMPGGFTLRQLPPIRWPASSFFTKGTESTSEAFTVPP
jgi:hypothetical protein